MCPKSPTVAGFDVLEALKNMEVGGESAGIRTLDLLIKSQLLYRLSYALPWRAWLPFGSARNICRAIRSVNPKKALSAINPVFFVAPPKR